MQTKDDIFQELKNVLATLFEIDPGMIRLDAKLYEELDLDSIDAIDMIVELQEITGKKVDPDDFKSVRTVQNVVDIVHAMMNEKN